MSNDLKPCPFCGSSARLLGCGKPFEDEDGRQTTATAVACNNDQCQAAGPFLASSEQAAEAWNRLLRAPVRVKLPDGNPYPVHGAAAYYSRQQVIDMLKAQGVEVAP